MKQNSNRYKRVFSYFNRNARKTMRLEFCVNFGLSEQTFYNKANDNNHAGSFFHSREIEWLENWAKENGMPDDYQPEGFIGQIPATKPD